LRYLQHLKKRIYAVILAFIVLASAVLLFLWWNTSGTPRWDVQQRILMERFEKMQNLQVLSSHLLTHERFRNPAFFNANEFVLIARAKAVYGLDLSQVKLSRDQDEITVYLPPVKVQELVMNAKDVEFVGVKKGLLTSQQTFENFQQQAVENLHAQLAQQARDPQLLADATAQAKAYFETLFKAAGFETITFKDRDAYTEAMGF
jgi:ligand-binding sensor domain-containing protein